MEIARMKWNESGFGFFTGFWYYVVQEVKELLYQKVMGITYLQYFSKEKLDQNSI
jgi:hypothetical protein